MAGVGMLERARAEQWTDEEVVRRVLAGDLVMFELLMRRHNQRVYRAVRSILRDDAESEDVMQEAYVRAFEHLGQFEGRAQFSTWLTRIAVNESLKRLAARGRTQGLDWGPEDGEARFEGSLEGRAMTEPVSGELSPEAHASRNELSGLLEEAILALPAGYRAVLMLRELEGMSTAETAGALGLTEANVKVRLHRAHGLLREELFAQAGAAGKQAFAFHAVRCDRVVGAVMERIGT
ncbi:MAG TPA: RNA polymerase sigma factor [Terracidiphilus sp.]|nr:RNA polymerase sigma factor [Terracidiphilus sp.]